MKLPGKEGTDLLLALEILLSVIAILLLLLMSCLLAPLAYNFDLTGAQNKLQLQIRIYNCCYGLGASRNDGDINWYLLILGRHIAIKPKGPPSESPAQPTRSPEKTVSRSMLLKAIKDTGLRERGLNLIVAVWQNIKPHHVTVNGRIGFSEPHYTGWMMALAAMLQRDNRSYTIHIEGVWDEPCMEGEFCLAGKVIPGIIVWYILKFLMSAEVRTYYRKRRAQTVCSQTQAA